MTLNPDLVLGKSHVENLQRMHMLVSPHACVMHPNIHASIHVEDGIFVAFRQMFTSAHTHDRSC